MAREEARHLILPLHLVRERLEEGDEPVRVVARLGEDLHREGVGLHLRLPAEAVQVGHRREPGAELGDAAHGAAGKDRSTGHQDVLADLRVPVAVVVVRDVAQGDVPDLVRDHAGQLARIAGLEDGLGVDVDVPRRAREGVDLVVVHHVEVVVEGLRPGRTHELVAHVVHVLAHDPVVNEDQLAAHSVLEVVAQPLLLAERDGPAGGEPQQQQWGCTAQEERASATPQHRNPRACAAPP